MSIFDFFRSPMVRIPKPLDLDEYPPMMPLSCDATNVKKSMKNMLMVCLGGGMAYEDAKIAVNKEYGMALQRAEEMDEARMKNYLKNYEVWKKRREEKK